MKKSLLQCCNLIFIYTLLAPSVSRLTAFKIAKGLSFLQSNSVLSGIIIPIRYFLGLKFFYEEKSRDNNFHKFQIFGTQNIAAFLFIISISIPGELFAQSGTLLFTESDYHGNTLTDGMAGADAIPGISYQIYGTDEGGNKVGNILVGAYTGKNLSHYFFVDENESYMGLPFHKLVIESEGGEAFGLSSFNVFDELGEAPNFEITGYLNNDPVATQSQNVPAFGDIEINLNPDFDNVNRVEIINTNGDITESFNKFVFDNPPSTPATLPTVTTGSPSNIGSTSATVSGNVSGDGGDPVTERGFVYATSSNPTTSDSKVESGSGTGQFSEIISGLDPETTYYVRAYAINAEGTAYGSEESFTTEPESDVCSINSTISSVEDLANDYMHFSQSFTSCKEGKINHIKLLANAVGSNYPVDTVIMTIREGDGLSGTILKTIEISTSIFNEATDLDDFITIEISDYNIIVSKGSQYTFGFEGDPSNQVQIYFSDTTPLASIYSGGQLYADGTTYADRDLIFKMEIGPLPSAALPTVFMESVIHVNATSANFSGNVTNDRGDTVTERGFVYATSSNPTTSDSKVESGSGTGQFSEIISGLAPQTTYFVRAYAINGEGTAYGSEESFTTLSLFAGGDGTAEDPYHVATAEQLDAVRDYLDSHFIQTADIDLGGSPWSDGDGWEPIKGECLFEMDGDCMGYAAFSGGYDGDGHEIRNLFVDSESQNVGLFNTVEATIKNLRLVNVDIKGGWSAGAISGRVDSGYYSNLTVEGKIEGQGSVGGLFGDLYNSVVTEVLGEVSVIKMGGGSAVGGVFGLSAGAVISNSFVTGTITAEGGSDIGGFGGRYVASGSAQNNQLINNYSAVVVNTTSVSNVGGFVGHIIDGNGIYGEEGNFWDAELSGQANSALGTGKSTSEMKDIETFTDANWDFDDVWQINEPSGGSISYPYLQNNTQDPPPGYIEVNDPPTVTTATPTSITLTSANVGGNATDDGGATVTERGIAWGTNPKPDIDDNKFAIGSGTGSFNDELDGLSSGVTYYVRAFATNSAGTAYGNEREFTTNVEVTSIQRHDPVAALTNNPEVIFQIKFSGSVSGLSTSNFAVNETGDVDGASVESISGSGDTYEVLVNTGAGNGTVRLDFVNNTDLTPNVVAIPFTGGQTYTIDKTPPTVTISSDETSPTNADPIPVDIEFSEPVAGFSEGDISVSGGTASNFSGSGAEYSVDITPTGDGTITVDLAAGVAEDEAGNVNEAADQFSIVSDRTAPQITSISAQQTSPTNETDLEFELVFSEDVQEPVAGDFNITNGSFASVTGNGDTWILTVNPDVPNSEVTITVEVVQGEIEDLAGNKLDNSESESIDYDGVAPQITSINAVETGTSDNISGPTNKTSFDIRVLFSEDVENLDLNGLTITPTDVFDSEYIIIKDHVMTIPVEITSVDQQDLVEIEITFNVGLVADLAGNKYSGGDDFDITFDGTRPTVTLSSPVETTNLGTIPITIQFSEVVSNFTADDITVENGSIDIESFSDEGGGEFTVDINPGNTDSGENYAISVSIPENAAEDLAGNLSQGSDEDLVIIYDASLFTVEFSSDEEDFTNKFSFEVNITFNKPATGFEVSDIAVSNATLSNFSANAEEDEFTVTVTPDSEGEVTLDIAENATYDEVGNGNEVANTFRIMSDRTSPTITSIERAEGVTDPTNEPVFDIIITFSEEIADFDESALNVTNASATGFKTPDNTEFTVTIEADPVTRSSTTIEVEVPAGVYTDLAGNGNEAGDEKLSIRYIPTPPKVLLLSPEMDMEVVGGYPKFEWQVESLATSYELQVSINPDFSSGSLVKDVEGIDEAHYIGVEQLESDKDYFWRVRGSNEGFTGEWSDVFSFTQLPTPPPAVTLHSPSNEAADVALLPELIWESADRAAVYQLQITTEDNFRSPKIDHELSGTSHTVSDDLLQKHTYRWRVRAINSGGTGEWSEVWTFTTRPAPPARVVLSAPADAVGAVPFSPNLSWETSDLARSYHLQISKNDSFDELVAEAENLTEAEFSPESELKDYTTYYWRVEAKNVSGSSGWSDTASFVTQANVPQELFPFNQAADVSTAPRLEWRSDYDTRFRVQLADSDAFDNPRTDSLLTSQSIQITGLDDAETYFWRVRVESDETSSEWMASQKFSTRKAPGESDDFDPVVRGSVDFGGTSNRQNRQISQMDYRLVGLPGVDAYSVEQLFEGEYGSEWRAYLETGSDNDYFEEFEPGDDRFLFKPGRGFWVLSTEVVNLDYSVTSVSTNELDAYRIDVHPGWNIIANPHSGSVSWDDVRELNEIDGELFAYNEQFVSSDSLHPVQGYYFYNDPDQLVSSLDIPYSGMDRRRSSDGEQAMLAGKMSEMNAAPSTVGITARFESGVMLQSELVYDVHGEDQGRYLRPFPSLEMAKTGMMLTDDSIKRGGLLRGESFYDREGNRYGLELKGEVGETFRWKANLSGLGDRARVLLINPITRQSWMLADGDEAEARISEPHTTYELYTGDEAYLTGKQQELMPAEITLKPNYPNPFNPTTNIRYAIPQNQHVRLEVFDIVGRRVQVLQDGVQQAGWHNAQFDARHLASGIYFYRLHVGETMQVGRMTMIK